MPQNFEKQNDIQKYLNNDNNTNKQLRKTDKSNHINNIPDMTDIIMTKNKKETGSTNINILNVLGNKMYQIFFGYMKNVIAIILIVQINHHLQRWVHFLFID